MTLASRILERFRGRLARWVERERRTHGCATTAVKRISSKIKMSPASIYRALNGYGDVQVKAHQYMALIMHTMRAPQISQSRKTNSSKLFQAGTNLSA